MPATEPLGATASSRGVSRLRRNPSEHGAQANTQSNNPSTSSLPPSRASSTGDDSADPADMRAHMDNLTDKVKERTRRSTDERRGSEESATNKRLSALLDRGSRKLKRKEKNTAGGGGSNNTLGVHSGESTGDLALSDERSDASLLDEDGRSSLLTDDGSDMEGSSTALANQRRCSLRAERELSERLVTRRVYAMTPFLLGVAPPCQCSPSGRKRRIQLPVCLDHRCKGVAKPVRPTISPHQSHQGYLTLSSPQLQAQPHAVTDTPDNPAAAVPPLNESTSSLPHIIEPPGTTTRATFPTANPAAKRNRNASSSPADKLRAGFARNRRKSNDSRVGGESGALAAGIGGLFKPRSRKNSISSQEPVPAEPHETISAPTEPGPDEPVSSIQPPPAETVTAAPETPPQPAPQPGVSEQQRETSTPTPTLRRTRLNTSTSLPDTPPSIPGTPTTLVTPPTPTDPSHATFPASPTAKQSPKKPLSSVESIRHRRAQSQTLPSKLSNSIPAPLTPTIEEAKTPGGTLTQPATASGFFSSVFNVAQKAADQLSTSINTGQKNKPTTAAAKLQEGGGEEIIPGVENTGNESDISKQPAVETLGKGDLSLSQLGIAESMNSTSDLLRQQDEYNASPQANKAEEDAAARAVSVAYEKPVATTISQAMGARPISVASQDRLTLNGDQTPPRSGADGEGLKRSGSVRSKLSGRRRRHRASSATTNTHATAANSIAAALKDSASGFSTVNPNGPVHRQTGFAVASSKRNKDFHQLFRSVPEDDYLIEDYSAALQRDILLHGRLYVSEGHICFSSNIFGWVTNLVISFDEVVSVEKKNTAVVFPNAIVIQTLQARNTFASFVARDSTYDLLIGIWKISHPNLKSSLNGVALDNAGASDKTEKADSIASEDMSDDASEDEIYDEDDDDDDFGSYTEPEAGRSMAGSDVGDAILSRKASAQPLGGAAQSNVNLSRTLDASEAAAAGTPAGGDFPGPQAHAPTECTDATEHYDRPLTDCTIPAPLGKVYSLMFGPASGAFMKRWLVEDQKSRELDLTDDKTGLDNDHKSLTFSYIKPLSGAVGPKQTKCITTNTLEAFDLEKAVTVNCSTQTPDVPSGSVFTTKTKYCLMWGPGNSTRMIANCTIEWTGKSWLRGPIESGAQAGQTQYVKDITSALTAAVSTKAPTKPGPGARKGKRKGKKGDALDSLAANEQRATVPADANKPTWGFWEPLRAPADMLTPFFTSQVLIAVLLTLLFSFHRLSPARAAAYEELWRREESELWDWLEDRVGLGDDFHAPLSGGAGAKDRQKVLSAREMGRRLESEGMRAREVDDAIRVTEERLSALKGAVERAKGE
ncbi:hypothetical protein Q7P37_007977 [Cladosporium fusiforme]